jgi:hypothetical protein
MHVNSASSGRSISAAGESLGGRGKNAIARCRSRRGVEVINGNAMEV